MLLNAVSSRDSHVGTEQIRRSPTQASLKDISCSKHPQNMMRFVLTFRSQCGVDREPVLHVKELLTSLVVPEAILLAESPPVPT